MNTSMTQPESPVVLVRQLWCSYGDFSAVQDVSFSVERGTIHALLGTNGAGKTTTLEAIQGFHRPDEGSIEVFGVSPVRDRSLIAARTGTMLQESGLVDEMTVGGQLGLWQKLCTRTDHPDRVLELVGLSHRRKVPVSVLSGGERRRLDFAMALFGGPELLVLDEPTTGLDPQSRQTMWQIITDLVFTGTAVLLTTHYLDEAQSLADTVTILDRGRVAREGTMGQVLSSIPGSIAFTVRAAARTVDALAAQVGGDLTTSPAGSELRVVIRTTDIQDDVGTVIDWTRRHRLVIDGLRSAPASLEEVFLGVAAATNGPNGSGVRTDQEETA
ncbi:MAG: ABC transporter ATP-binding protein [Propionibacteriales bacterium]|nr:ABC transporter ATP-binding protein [Propionibacteriales bacterium]